MNSKEHFQYAGESQQILTIWTIIIANSIPIKDVTN